MNEDSKELLTELFAEIECAWTDGQDRTLVFKLAQQHPEFSEELHEFFADLVVDPVYPDEVANRFLEGEERVAEWLNQSAFDIASSVTAAPKDTSTSTSADAETPEYGSNLIVFLKKRTQNALPNIVRRLENVTVEYLILVSRHPQIVPQRAKEFIAKQIEDVWGISSGDSFHFLTVNPRAVRAASRSSPFGPEPRTFEELLKRSDLSKEQMSFWLNLH
jgi:hypothetical protein